MLSGIGDPETLRAHQIPVNVALPGVGHNLQDHVSVTVAYGRKEPGPLHAKMRADRIAGTKPASTRLMETSKPRSAQYSSIFAFSSASLSPSP